MVVVHSPEAGLIPTAPDPTSVADILTAAADLIEKPGAWIQGWLSRAPDGRASSQRIVEGASCWCLEGALLAASPEYGSNAAFAAVKDHLAETCLFRWNDDPTRTQAEVVAALRAAAEKARTADAAKRGGDAEGVNP